MNEYSTSHLARNVLKWIMNTLAVEGVDYSYNPTNPEMIIFDITELDRNMQSKLMKYLKPRTAENRIIPLIRKIIKEERQKLRMKEDRIIESFDDEIDELATNLIEYLGTELPKQGWNRNPRIVNWFRDNGIQPTTQIAQDIYRRALELNQDNKPKNRRYLDN